MSGHGKRNETESQYRAGEGFGANLLLVVGAQFVRCRFLPILPACTCVCSVAIDGWGDKMKHQSSEEPESGMRVYLREIAKVPLLRGAF